MYNMTCLTSAENLGVMTSCANTATDGVMIGGFTVGLFFVLLVALRRGGSFDMDNCVLVSSFAMFLLSAVLVYGGLLSIMYPLAYLMILAFTGLYVWTVKE